MTKSEIISKVKQAILKFAKPSRIYLYGSQASGDATQNSDIDIAYDDKEFKKNYLIEEEIKTLNTLIKVDVKNLAGTSERFQNRVKSTAKILYSASKELRAEDGLYNFSNALKRLTSAIEQEQVIIDEGFNDMYLDLTIKRFEFTYEMAWKALKRYLEYLGFVVKSPRASFKEGYAQGVIEDENLWLNMIEHRNLSSHIYDEYQIREIVDSVPRYKDAFVLLEAKLKAQLNI